MSKNNNNNIFNRTANRIRSLDMFGYAFQWQFNGSDSNNTLVGGLASIFVNFLILWQS